MADEFDLFRLKAMFKHWEVFPPLPLTVRRIAVEFAGLEFKQPQVSAKPPDDDLISALSQLGNQI